MTVAGQTQTIDTFDNANWLTNIQQGSNNIISGCDDADRRTRVTNGCNNGSEFTSPTHTDNLAGKQVRTSATFARPNIPSVLTTTNYTANNQ